MWELLGGRQLKNGSEFGGERVLIIGLISKLKNSTLWGKYGTFGGFVTRHEGGEVLWKNAGEKKWKYMNLSFFWFHCINSFGFLLSNLAVV